MQKRKFIKVILIFSSAVFVLGIILTAAGTILGKGTLPRSFHYRYEYGIPHNSDGENDSHDDIEDDIQDFFEEFGIPQSGYDEYERNTEI